MAISIKSWGKNNIVESNRREFLKNAGTLGLSANIVNLDDNLAKIGDMAFDPDDEVAYVAGWSNKIDDNGDVKKDPMYKTMSHEKWANLQATNSAARQIGRELDNMAPEKNHQISIIESIDKNSDTGRRLDVAIMEDGVYESVLQDISRMVGGEAEIIDEKLKVPVGVTELDFRGQNHECYSTPYEEFDDVPAAAPMRAPATSLKPGCTAGPYIHDQHGEGWITAEHVVEDIGNEVLLSENGHRATHSAIGEVQDCYSESGNDYVIDIAFINDAEANKTPYEWIADEDYSGNSDIPITTVLADIELEAQQGNSGWNINMQGQANCRQESYVHDMMRDSNGEIVGFLLDDEYSEDGDSGGPYFHERDGEAYMAGVHTGVFEGGFFTPDRSGGNTAETVEELLNGDWMTQ